MRKISKNNSYSSNANARHFVKSSGVYFLGSILSKIMVFLLLPIYTKYISPLDYGYYDLTLVYITIGSSIIFFDIGTSIMRFMYDDKDMQSQAKVIESGFSIFKLSACIYVIISLALLITTDIKYLYLILIFGLLSALTNMYGFIARGRGDNRGFAVSGVINTFISSFLGVVLVTAARYDFSALYIAAIFGSIAQIAHLEYRNKIFRYMLSVKMVKNELTKTIFIYTLPLFINSLAFWLLTGYNRIVITQELSLGDNGVYALGSRIVIVITLLTTIFAYSWQDLSFAKASEDNAAKFYTRASNFYITVLSAGIAILLPLFSLFFSHFINGSYQSARGLMPLLVVSAALAAYVSFTGSIFHSIKNTKGLFYSMAVSAIINVVLCIPLVRVAGLNGATLSTIIALFSCCVLRAYILKKHFTYNIHTRVLLLSTFWVFTVGIIYFQSNTITDLLVLLTNVLISGYIFRDIIKQSLGAFSAIITRTQS